MRAGEGRQPHKEARILGAEADPFFGKRDRLRRLAAVKVHLAKQDMSGGITGVKIYRLLERRHRGIRAAGPHTD